MTVSNPSPEAFALCSSCGAARASTQHRCGACGEPYAEPTPEAVFEDNARWARLESQFRCPGCGALSPVNHFELDGKVTCAQCGTEHAFDVGAWSKALSWSHDVVSLSAVDPAVRAAQSNSPLVLDNPYHHVGVAVADRSWEQAGVVAGHGTLSVRCSPGHPLCPRCHMPQVRQAEGPGRLLLSCPRCALRHEYQLASQARGLYAGLALAAAAAYRSDISHARTQFTEGGVASVNCPNCGGPLGVTSGETTVVCPHCQMQSLISSKLWFRLGVREPRSEAMWLLFTGHSARRQQLEAKNADVDPFEAELEARARAVLGQLQPPPPAPAPVRAASPGPATFPNNYPAPYNPTAAGLRPRSNAVRAIVVVVIVIACITGIVGLVVASVLGR